ncbi:hypothetical protein C7999DRAFT_27850 [Corynascus novoguineensis]|uniref:Uncharacterized protein n=1 Tax=Corynascus novoguineensis TaxID=1126955 RepID=A0AAN7D1J8_9PEZI|nr:hypothetical protein C7999DRAFT_27850 [Corynascus novoguineensis]
MSLATAAPAQGSNAIPALAEPSESQRDPGVNGGETQRELEKKKKRSLFGFGKKKTEAPAKAAPPRSKPAPSTSRTTTASPIRTDHAPLSPASPGRHGFASSPRLASPAGSQIFERDVQESAASLVPSSPAIPSHIQTENYIPPVLDASSEAITDNHLNPDTVEIITHTSHQPAALAVTGGLGPYPTSATPAAPPAEASWADELAAFSASDNNTNPTSTTTPATADTASNYGSFDTTDVRRLSFISFADVVLAEQSQNGSFFGAGSAAGSPSRESMYLAGLSSFPPPPTSAGGNNRDPRSASPIRSPVSSSGGFGGQQQQRPGSVSPPTSKSGSIRASSPATAGGQGRVRGSSPAGRSSLGSPTSLLSMQLSSPGGPGGAHGGGEIAIETMSQALRRTGSGDLSVGSGGGSGERVRSFPGSPTA